LNKNLAILITLACTLSSSLALVETSVYIGKGTAYTGETTKITLITENTGYTAERDIQLKLKLPQELGGDKNTTIEHLDPQSQVTEQYNIIIPSDTEPGNYPVYATTAYGNKEYKVQEQNLKILKFPLELQTSLTKDTVSSKENTSITVDIANIGTNELENVKINIIADSFIELEREELPVGLLSINHETRKEFSLTSPNTPGDYSIIVQVEFEDLLGKHVKTETSTLHVTRGFSLITAAIAVLLAAAIVILAKRYFG